MLRLQFAMLRLVHRNARSHRMHQNARSHLMHQNARHQQRRMHQHPTPAAYKFAFVSLLPVRKAPLMGFENNLRAPFYGPESPARAALMEVLATLHDVAHERSESDSRGRGVCVVGSKGTGTSTVLHTAVTLTRELLPQYERVVYWSAGRSRTKTRSGNLFHQMLGDLLGDARHNNVASGPWALFVDDAHYLTDEEWDSMRRCVRKKGGEAGAGGEAGGEADFAADPPFCVIVAGDYSTMTRINDRQSGDVQACFSRVAVPPLQSMTEYRAFHKHVWEDVRRSHGHDIAAPTETQVDDAARAWHLMTGGNFAELFRLSDPECMALALLPDDEAAALRVERMMTWPDCTTPEELCVLFLDDKLRRSTSKDRRKLGSVCPFEASAVTATADELFRGRILLAKQDFLLALPDLCDLGYLRVVSSPYPTCVETDTNKFDTRYGLGRPFLALTQEQWQQEWNHCTAQAKLAARRMEGSEGRRI